MMQHYPASGTSPAIEQRVQGDYVPWQPTIVGFPCLEFNLTTCMRKGPTEWGSETSCCGDKRHVGLSRVSRKPCMSKLLKPSLFSLRFTILVESRKPFAVRNDHGINYSPCTNLAVTSPGFHVGHCKPTSFM